MDVILYKDNSWGCSNIVKRGFNLEFLSETSYKRIVKYEIKNLFIVDGEFNHGDEVTAIVKDGPSLKGFEGKLIDKKIFKDVVVSKEIDKSEINRIINIIKQ